MKVGIEKDDKGKYDRQIMFTNRRLSEEDTHSNKNKKKQ